MDTLSLKDVKFLTGIIENRLLEYRIKNHTGKIIGLKIPNKDKRKRNHYIFTEKEMETFIIEDKIRREKAIHNRQGFSKNFKNIHKLKDF